MKNHFIRLGRVFLVMLLLLVNVNLDQKRSISALGGIPAGTVYESDENSTSLTLVGESTNSHTHPFMLWVQNDLVLIAVRSTHDLKSMDVIGTSTIHNSDMKVHADLEKITVDDKANLNPASDLSGDLKDAHWTIFSFPKSIISTSGTYYFFIEGIGNGHDVEADYQVIIPTVKAMVEKTWINGPMPEIELTLQRRVLGSEYELATGLPNKVITNPITLTPNDGGEASFVWNELPYTNTIGQIYDYNVKETNPGSGYTLSATSSYDDQTLTYHFSLTNTYTQPLGDVSAKKAWVGGSVRTAVYFEFYRSVDGMNSELLDTVMLDGIVDENNSLARETSPWVYTWSYLPQKTIDGIDYNYYVVETNALPNYVSSGNGGLEITNTYVIPLNDVTVSKDWVDGPLERPTVQLQLYRNGVAYLEPISLENGFSEYTWDDLESTDIDGNPYVYTIDEVSVPMNYEKTLSEDGLTVTNTYVIPLIDVTGNKVWIDGPVERPTVELQLFRNGEAYFTPVSLDSGTTNFTWYDLEATDIDGNPYVYTVDEVNVPMNYEKTLSEDGLTVTNTYVIPMIDITGYKVWSYGPVDRPTVELQLFRNDETYLRPVSLDNGTSEHTWYDLEATDIHGNRYVYTIDEVDVPMNYEKSLSEDGLTVTNTYVIPVKDVTGYKEWIDGPVERPTVELQLFRNGKTYLTPVKLESGTTDFTWYSLDGTDIYGNPYVYTVDEVNVPMNYEKSLSEDRLTVTNTYVIPLISITGTKVWVNGPKDKPMIELQLYQDGEEYGDEVYLLNGDLSHTWFNVEQTDRMGNPYTYTIDEPTIPANYTKSISEDGLTITNTFHEPVKDVEVIPLPSTGIDDDSVATLVIVLIVGGIGVLLYQRRNRNKDRK